MVGGWDANDWQLVDGKRRAVRSRCACVRP